MEKIQVIGIDIVKLKFDVCALFQRKTRRKIFANNTSGFKELTTLTSDLDLENPQFCMRKISRLVSEIPYKSSVLEDLSWFD